MDPKFSIKDPIKRAAYVKNRRDKYRSRRRLYLKSLLKKCVTCGIDDKRVLQWAHLPQYRRNGNQRAKMGNIIFNSSYNKLANELAKCIVLCANCHLIFDSKPAGN